MRNRLINRIAPPCVLLSVGICIWFVSSHHAELPITISPASAVDQTVITPTTEITSTIPAPIISPLVQKNNGMIRFSIDTKPYKNVQKVEYYVEDILIGASYTNPYSVSVGEANLKPGTHKVVAMVYSNSATASSLPTSFISALTTVSSISEATPPVNSSSAATVVSTGVQPVDPATPPTSPIIAPTNVAAVANADNSVTISWMASDSATSYQIWRDGAKIGTTSSTAYDDPGLTTGQTYDYSVIAVDASSRMSDPSPQVAVTIPIPPQTNQGATASPTQTDSQK